MIVKEILDSVEVIPDPYIKSATYAKIGEKLAKARNNGYRVAFMKALETAKNIDDPAKMFKALLSVGYSMGRAGLKSSKRVYSHVMEDSRILSPPDRDSVMQIAASYMLALGEISEAITYALEIENPTLRDDVLLTIIHVNTKLIEKEQIKVAYRLRKSKLALEHIEGEPQRSRAILDIIKAHIVLKSYENAIGHLKEINDPDWARQAFKEIVFRLKEHEVLGHLLESLESAANELVERFGDEFTYHLAFAFALAGEGVQAVNMLEPLEDPYLIVKMALELLERDPDSLQALVSALDPETAEVVGKAVMNAILDNPELATDGVISAIGKSTSSEEVWAKIARYYILTGDLDVAVRIGRMLKTPRLHSLIMAAVAHKLVKMGRVEEAIDTALEVGDRKFASIIVAEILIEALEKEIGGRVEQWNSSEAS